MDWMQLLAQFGFPITACCAVAAAIWHACRWSASNVVIPLRDRHFQFMDKIEESHNGLAKGIETGFARIHERLDDIREDQVDHKSICEGHTSHAGHARKDAP